MNAAWGEAEPHLEQKVAIEALNAEVNRQRFRHVETVSASATAIPFSKRDAKDKIYAGGRSSPAGFRRAASISQTT